MPGFNADEKIAAGVSPIGLGLVVDKQEPGQIVIGWNLDVCPPGGDERAALEGLIGNKNVIIPERTCFDAVLDPGKGLVGISCFGGVPGMGAGDC